MVIATLRDKIFKLAPFFRYISSDSQRSLHKAMDVWLKVDNRQLNKITEEEEIEMRHQVKILESIEKRLNT